jgi:SAM-dependent methyltransferase
MNVCRICEAPLAFWNTAREMHFGTRETFDYLICTDCGCLQIAEIPDELGRFYPADYYTRGDRSAARQTAKPASKLRVARTSLLLRAGPSARRLAGRRYGRFDWFTQTSTRRDDSILDVGCGSGRLLRNLHRDGFTDLTGIDPGLACTPSHEQNPRFERRSLEEHLRELRASDAGRRANDRDHCTYRLVMSHHSFEHVVDPREAFRSMACLTRPGGWLLLRLPLADSWACRHYGVDWVQLDAPRHLHLHTRRSIRRLAEDFGFEVARVVDDSKAFQIVGSERIRRDLPLIVGPDAQATGSEGSLVESIPGQRVRARLRARQLRASNQGDQACFYLRRIEHAPWLSKVGADDDPT